MAQQVTFGRRGVRSPTPAPSPIRTPDRPEPSSPELEAFAASIKDAELSDAAEFARWRRQQYPRRLLIILVGLALLAPGLVCFVVQAPLWVSLGLEAAGLFANGWLRQERRRQASAIAAWTPAGDGLD
ncbi:MAG: hypothetical protein ACXWK1_19905 [Caulobacteraceae bacterium]